MPVKQGFASIQWTYTTLDQAKMSKLLSLYDPDYPRVNLTYNDPLTGGYVDVYAMTSDPTIGSRETLVFHNVTVRFTRLADTATA